MKKNILTFITVLLTSSLFGQIPTLPVDTAIRKGTLANGLTYYIRHNAEPQHQVNFYIAQKVGSILEEESQRGLAHFLEHMCFNGTVHFPGNGVIQYCQRIGVQFGKDLNAYTSIDETVYNIDHVPTSTPGVIDSCLLILHDWADGLSLLDADIDHERGVIHEEWRTRSNATLRLYEAITPLIYPDNRYGIRFPIGLMSVVDSFPYHVLRDYYDKWYRTDLQGIVVVGDIDVDEIEQKIKAIFSPIAAVEHPAERTYFPIADNQEPIIAIASDKEQTIAQTFLFLKHDNIPDEDKSSIGYYVYRYALQMATEMLNARLQEILEKPDAPFSYATSGEDDFFIAKTKQALMGICIGEDTKLVESITALYRELLRAIRNGFTAGEYERARMEYLSQIETAYNAREKKKSKDYCQEIVRHFIDNEPLMSAEQEYVLANDILPNISIDVINQIVSKTWSDSTNLVLAAMLPQKEGVNYPTTDSLRQVLHAVEAEDIRPYEDTSDLPPLISHQPKAGKIKKREPAAYGYTKLTLQNGVQVYLKHTDYNKDEVQMNAFSEGGTSLYEDSESLNLLMAMEVAQVGGYGNFSQSDLKKSLAGKQVSLTPVLSYYDEELIGSSTPKDVETMLQLTYLCFTDIRKDAEAFQSWKQRTYATKINQEQEPLVAFQDTLLANLYNHHPRVRNLKAQWVDSIDYDRCLEIVRERFSNAADFSFVITGAYDETTIERHIEQYLGSLPTSKKREHYRNINLELATGAQQVVFNRSMEVPMSSIYYIQNGTQPYDMRYQIASKLIADILGIVYTEEIREKEGGTYFVVSHIEQIPWPISTCLAQTFYQTNPERYEYLNSKIDSIQSDFAHNGPSETNLNKVRASMLKEHYQSLTENTYWSNQMVQLLLYGVNLHDGYEEMLNSLTTSDLRLIYNELIDQQNMLKIIMIGEK